MRLEICWIKTKSFRQIIYEVPPTILYAKQQIEGQRFIRMGKSRSKSFQLSERILFVGSFLCQFYPRGQTHAENFPNDKVKEIQCFLLPTWIEAL